MIARYTRPDMGAIWEERAKYIQWTRVEFAVCEALAEDGKIPAADWKKLKAGLEKVINEGGVDPIRVDVHEAITRHDVIAFTTALAELLGAESRYVHFGLTSSDVVDTALSLQMIEAGRILLKGVDALLAVLKSRALQYKELPTIGRSHGIFAEPTSFGMKFLAYFCEWTRNRERLVRALDEAAFGKLSGAVGVNAHFTPAFETKVLAKLGLKREPVASQVLPRDRHADLMNTFAILGAGIERIAIELRHLQRSEVGEVREGFAAKQKGSSAMPHKRNPISSENLTGAARLLRSYAQAALENVALWHERDISHSSVERVIFPDATILLDYAIHRMTGVLTGLEVLEERVRGNLKEAGPVVFSGHLLLALVEAGATREDGYRWIQACALEALNRGSGGADFLDLLVAHPDLIKHLSADKIRSFTSIEYQLRNVDAVYQSVLV